MCGIAGIIGSSANIDTVTAMTDRLRHRGPNGAGIWSAPGVVLGHRRLSSVPHMEGIRRERICLLAH